jgi:branched-chain amino acid transport system permease protein
VQIFLQQLINGLVLGSLIGFIALGYSLVYSILKLINFAHGHLVTLAAYLFITISTQFGLINDFNFIWAILIMLIIVILIVILIELLAYRPLRKAHRLSVIVSALGAGMVVQNIIMLIWGADPKVFPEIPILNGILSFNGIVVTKLNILVLIMNCLVMGILYLFIHRFRTGIAIRALAQDYQTAQLMGVNINNIIVLVFIIGAILGSMGGVLIGLTYKTVTFDMGFEYGLKAFMATIIGGIGSIPGAMLGGILIGLLQTFSAGYISSTWATVITYFILIVFLMIRPRGIIGSKNIIKV